MRALRTLSVRPWLPWSVMLALLLVPCGCKKKAPEKAEAKKEAPAPAAEEKPAPEVPAEEPPTEVEPAVAADVVDAAPEPEAAVPPAEAPKAEVPSTSPPKESKVYATDADKARMAELFADMWCAELRGADQAELLKVYHKYNYPPLDRWYDDWNAVIVDRNWVRETVAKARSRCPEAAKKATVGAMVPEKPAPEGETAPAKADEAKPETPAPEAGAGEPTK